MTELQTEKPADQQKYADAEPVLELFDFLVEYPSIDRESNTVYDNTTEVVGVSLNIEYVVNVNFPPLVKISSWVKPFLDISSKDPAVDLFGLYGFPAYVKVGALQESNVGDPIWLTLDETPRPFVGLALEGPESQHKLYLAGMDNEFVNPLSIQMGSYRRPNVRIFVPGLSATIPMDPKPQTPHAWAVCSLFGYDLADRKWYLWDESQNGPATFGDISNWNNFNDRALVPSGIQGLFMEVQTRGGHRPVEITLDDITGVLDTITRVVGVMATVVGMFA